MEKENFMSFKIEDEILTLEEVHEAEERGNHPYHFRLTTPETGEIHEWLSPTKEDAFRHLFAKLPLFSLKMIRLVSESAFTATQSYKLLLVFGYVTMPSIYPAEVAELYDTYIRKNTANLFHAGAYAEAYETLLIHAFKIGKPSKIAINTAIKCLSAIPADDYDRIYKFLTDHFSRLYPKSMHIGLLNKAQRDEAILRMRELSLSEEIITAFGKGFKIMVSEQELSSLEIKMEGADKFGFCRKTFTGEDLNLLNDNGKVWHFATAVPSTQCLQQVKEAEAEYYVLVYHIHKYMPMNGVVLYTFLVIEENPDEWKYAREMTRKGLPDCIAVIYGYGGFEYGSLPVKPMRGRLFRTN